MSYIEREAAIKAIENDCPEAVYYTKRDAIDCIEAQPTADVVAVVRCKDCKYYEIHKPSVTLNCEREGKLIPMMPNDYCSYGERRENGIKIWNRRAENGKS